MGFFVSSALFAELPLRRKDVSSLSKVFNIIEFGMEATDEEIINRLVTEDINRIQAQIIPSEKDIELLNKIYKIKPDLPFRFYGCYSKEDLNIDFLLKLDKVRVLSIEIYQPIKNIEILCKLNLKKLTIDCFNVKDYSFLKNINSNLKELTIDLEDKTYKMDINDILHMKHLEGLYIRNVKKGLDKIKEFKSLKSLLFRSINITDYSFLKEMNVRKLSLCFQKPEYFNTFGINENIEEIELWRNPKLTDLSFLLQFPNLKKVVINDQSKVEIIPDLRSLTKLKEIYFMDKKAVELEKLVSSNVKVYSYYNPCDLD